MMVRAMEVAKYLIYLRDKDENNGQYYSLSNLKLQKLLYYCQVGHYKWDFEQLIDDVDNILFEAWDYGPVIPEIYFEFKKFGQNDVYSEDFNFKLRKNQKETIEAVWEQLRNKSAFQLVDLTHSEQPWIHARMLKVMFIKENELRNFYNSQEEVTY